MAENRTGNFELDNPENFPAEVFDAFLTFVYTNELDFKQIDVALFFLDLSFHIQSPHLRKKALEFVDSQVTKMTNLQMLELLSIKIKQENWEPLKQFCDWLVLSQGTLISSIYIPERETALLAQVIACTYSYKITPLKEKVCDLWSTLKTSQ